MGKYSFSTKSKIKRIALRILVVLLLTGVGFGAYYYFSHREVNIIETNLKGTKYEYLDRFFERKDNDKFVYTLKGIVYNARENSSDITFDMNVWDLNSRESLYYTDISIPSLNMEDMVLEDILYDFKPVTIEFEFKNKNLSNLTVKELLLGENEYKRVNTEILGFLTKGYTADVEDEKEYPAILPVNVLGKTALPIYVNADGLNALYGITGLNGSKDLAISFDADEYIDELIARIKSGVESAKLGFPRIPSSCSLVYNLNKSGKYSDLQISKIRDVFCNQYTFSTMTLKNEESKWDELLAFIDSGKLDMNYQPDVLFSGLMYISDFYSLSSLYRKPLKASEIIAVENWVVNSVTFSGRDNTTYALPYKTLCSLASSLKSIPGYKGIPKYSSMVNTLGEIVVNYASNEELLKSMEKDTSSTLMCADAFIDSDNVELRRLFNSVITKMYNLNFYKDGMYTGFWSVSPESEISMNINDNVRYFNLLKYSNAR